MARFKRVNGVRIQFTAEEEAQRDAEEAEQVIERQQRDAEFAQKATNKTNGNQKLLDLGLSQAEVDALLR